MRYRATILCMFAASLTTQAALVNISNLRAAWSDAVPGATITGNGTANPQARWGQDIGFGLSGYDYDAPSWSSLTVEVPPFPSSPFSIGTFRHVNQPVGFPSITSIRLTITADIDIDGVSFGSRDFIFDFLHDETVNDLNPCPFGGANGFGVNVNGCADRVRVFANGRTQDFVIGSEVYTLRIRGFEILGIEFDQFLTAERLINEATLMGDITLRSLVIPEPSTFLLAGSAALVALVVRLRK